MEDAANQTCVVFTWAGVKKNAFLDKIYKYFGIKRRAPNFAGDIEKYLNRNKRKYRKLCFWEVWNFKGTSKECAKNMLPHLEINGAKTNVKELTKIVKKLAKSRMVKHRTYAKKSLFIWEPSRR